MCTVVVPRLLILEGAPHPWRPLQQSSPHRPPPHAVTTARPGLQSLWTHLHCCCSCVLSVPHQGLHEVLAELERAHLEYHRSEHRPMLYSASPEVQRAYALVEGTYQDVGALPGHPATFRISKVHHILSMEVGRRGGGGLSGG